MKDNKNIRMYFILIIYVIDFKKNAWEELKVFYFGDKIFSVWN